MGYEAESEEEWVQDRMKLYGLTQKHSENEKSTRG